MTQITFELQNTDEVVARLKRAKIDVQNGLEAIVLAAARVIEDAARSNTTGAIAAGMTTEVLERKAKQVVAGVGPDKEQWYAVFVERGAKQHAITPDQKLALKFVDGTLRPMANHPGRAAQPFLRPALDNNGDEARSAAGDTLDSLLEQYR